MLIGQLLTALVRSIDPTIVAVGGLTMGADPLASATATMSYLGGAPLQAFYVRKEPKGHGTNQWVEAPARLPAGARVAILEDVVTTGAASLKAIEYTRAAGYDVACAITLVDRLEGGREAVTAQVPLHALFTRNDFGKSSV